MINRILHNVTNQVVTDPAAISGAFPKEIGSGSLTFSDSNWVIVGVYLFAILCIGIYFSFESKFKKKYVATSQDFFMASKSIPGWAVGFSLFATSLSAITFLSVPAQTFGSDWIIVIGSIIAPIFAPFLIKFVVPFFRKLKAESAYDYIQKRFGLHLRLFISVTFILYQTMRAAVVVYLPTIAIATILPSVNEYLIAGIVIVITIGYTYLGGIKSIIWADLIQGFLLTAGILVMIFWSMGLIDTYSVFSDQSGNPAYTDTSGTGGFAASAASANENGKFLSSGHWVFTLTGLGIPLVFMSFFVNAIYPLIGGQDVVQRYQASKTKRDVNFGISLNASLTVLVGVLMFYGFGTLLFQLFSATNQVAYNVLPFDYTDASSGQTVNISIIWVAQHTKDSGYGTNVFGYVQNFNGQTGWLPLVGSSGWNLDSARNWSSATLQDIQSLSIQGTNALDNGNLVSVNSIVSSYTDFSSSQGMVSNSNIVPYFIATILPVGVSGLIIAGILAASQSAMGSCFNASSRCFVNDILKLFYPNLTDKQKLIIGKVSVIVVGLFALLFTTVLIYTKQDSIFLFFNSVVGLFGASTMAIFFIGMFDNYVRNRAAVWGMWIGVIVALISFLLSYAPFMELFNQKILINSAWVAVFSFLATYVVSYLFQFIENIIRYSKNATLISYEKLTSLGVALKADNAKIEKWAKFGMNGLLAKNCVFNEHKKVDDFDYVKIYDNRWMLNKLGSNLYRSGKLSEKKIIILNRLGWAWFYLRYDVPRTDSEYYERIKNNTLKDISKSEKLFDLGENSWNWDALAYRKYVKNIYKNKVRTKDINKLEEKQLSFKEFQEKTSYDRYVLHTNIGNWFRSKKYKRQIIDKKDLKNAQDLFLKHDSI
ncbi:MAG: hypothetical protein HDR31_02060 [Mycoplasma sp.]|nr:hypothetical protein [Mycoplasma sp.]